MEIDRREYDFYLELKKLLFYSVDNVDFAKVMAKDFALIAFKDSVGFKWGWKDVFLQLFRTKDFSVLKNNLIENQIIFFSSINREDYNDLIIKCGADLEQAKFSPLYQLRTRYYFSFSNISLAFKLFLFQNDYQILPLFSRLYLTSTMVYNLNCYDEIKKEMSKIDFSKKRIISFNSAYGLEALLTQYFNTKSKNTFSLSHGISYVDFCKKYPLDKINGQNITANTLFVWGESCKSDVTENYELSADRVHIGGNPKYLYKRLNVKKEFRNGLILLGRVMYDRGNIEILKIIKDLSDTLTIDFKVKLHPSLNFDKYNTICCEYGFEVLDHKSKISEVMSSGLFDFAIVNNSTAYYESMYYELVCFRYRPDENEIFLGLDDKFSTADELINLISVFKNMDPEKLNNTIEELLIKTLGMGINNYSKYLNESK